MPHITRESKRLLHLGAPPVTPGQLNYCVSKVVEHWLGDSPNYEKYNAAIGVLEAAKLELYRCLIAPYEDTKIEENGSAYGS
jgi:hypothetical protein